MAYQVLHVACGRGVQPVLVWVTVSWKDLRYPHARSYTANLALLSSAPHPINSRGAFSCYFPQLYSPKIRVKPNVCMLLLGRLGKTAFCECSSNNIHSARFCVQIRFRLLGWIQKEVPTQYSWTGHRTKLASAPEQFSHFLCTAPSPLHDSAAFTSTACLFTCDALHSSQVCREALGWGVGVERGVVWPE